MDWLSCVRDYSRSLLADGGTPAVSAFTTFAGRMSVLAKSAELSNDHLVLRVADQGVSVSFYRGVLGFKHEGRVGPFEIVRVNDGLTLDLLQVASKTQVHLAFRVDRIAFEAVRERLESMSMPRGSDVFVRDGRIGSNPFGASGMADLFYVYDPDGHNLELRTHEVAKPECPRG